VKRRRGALRRRYGHSSPGGLRWSEPRRGTQRLLDVPASKGEVVVTTYPHFVEAVVAPASGTMSAEMVFKSTGDAMAWGESQAKRMGFLRAA